MEDKAKNASTKRTVFKVFVCVVLTICSLVVLYPIIYTISTAFSPLMTDANSNIIPFADGFSTLQFERLFLDEDYLLWVKNTLFLAICTCLLSVVVCSLSAYVFSRFKFAMRKGMMISMLVLQVFPSFVGMIAIYVIINRIGAADQLWGLVLVYVSGNIPYNTWLVKSYLDTIPKSLDEAARIDGANHMKIFFSVIFPIAKPIIIFLAITTFTGPWMDYIFPKMILSTSEHYTLAIGIMRFIESTTNKFTLFAAGAILVSVPFVIFFVAGQKAMTTGLGAAAVKG
ncbi:arabinogalactan oligomer / maltooligosaccharide transport system permease protein [Lachnospiraceae bacterium RM5]|nr:arabinogalactan oligomer / maltooligosaccharide transport system permease protein [Lachnospiraceae bacterium RM5]